MVDPKKVPMVRGEKLAMQLFRYEVARELGFPTAHDQKTPQVLPIQAIVGDIPRRMIELAEQHRRQNDGP